MILAVDIGNTNIVLGCVEREDDVTFVERLSTDRGRTVLEYAISIKNVLELYNIDPRQLEGAIISSVVPPLTRIVREAVRKITGYQALVVGPGLRTGLQILMDNPAQVGSDLVVDAVAAIHEHPVPLVVIDMGTATTLSVVDKDKNYIGGMIVPGMRGSLDSLVSRAAQLSNIDLEAPRRLIGKNTAECRKSGLVYGNAALLDGLIDRIEAELGQPVTVVATGGLAPLVLPYCKKKILVDDALLLKGMLILYRKNQEERHR